MFRFYFVGQKKKKKKFKIKKLFGLDNEKYLALTVAGVER
jgi:hypothetical protein